MAYATADQLAEALRIKATTTNQKLLEDCLAAAAEEIDHELDRDEPLGDPPPASVSRTNVNRAVEWYKAADAAYGMVGFDQVGVMQAPKDGFARHASAIIDAKQRFGVG